MDRTPERTQPPEPVDPAVSEAAEPSSAVSPAVRTEIVSRSEFRSRFWDSHLVELLVRVPDPHPVLGQPAALGLVIRNHGDQELKLPMVRRRGLWPFRKEMQAELVLDLAEDRFSVRTGRSQRSWRQVLKPEEDWIIPAFSEAEFLVPIPAPDRDNLDLVRMRLRATLFPLSVDFEGEAESLVAVVFPEQGMTWVTPSARAALDQLAPAALTEELLEDPPRLLAVCLALAPQHRLPVTDWLVGQLPGPDRPARAALVLALQVTTGLPLGSQVGRWQSWWSSEDGARWAMEQRLASRESSRTP